MLANVGVIHVMRYVYRLTLFHLMQEREQGCIFHFSNYRGDLISMCVSS